MEAETQEYHDPIYRLDDDSNSHVDTFKHYPPVSSSSISPSNSSFAPLSDAPSLEGLFGGASHMGLYEEQEQLYDENISEVPTNFSSSSPAEPIALAPIKFEERQQSSVAPSYSFSDHSSFSSEGDDVSDSEDSASTSETVEDAARSRGDADSDSEDSVSETSAPARTRVGKRPSALRCLRANMEAHVMTPNMKTPRRLSPQHLRMINPVLVNVCDMMNKGLIDIDTARSMMSEAFPALAPRFTVDFLSKARRGKVVSKYTQIELRSGLENLPRLAPSPARKPKVVTTTELVKEAQERLNKGQSVFEVANALGISRSRIYHWDVNGVVRIPK